MSLSAVNTRRLSPTVLNAFRAQAEEAEKLGRLPDGTVSLLKEVEMSKMLQLREYGGHESHPVHFLERVEEIASVNPSAGWVAAVVGVHPWEACLNDDRLLNELWRDNPDTWIASPYSPMGLLKPTQDGFLLNGKWTFSSGTDHCQWAVLGALVADETGSKPAQPWEMYHVMLPREDYSIIDDSWNVVGLEGTGSKDVVVNGAFVPMYRCLSVSKLMNGETVSERLLDKPLYRMPWSTVFPNAISAAVLGICLGAVNSAEEYIHRKIQGSASKEPDLYVVNCLGEAAVAVNSAIEKMHENVAGVYELACNGEVPSLERRAELRASQVDEVWRVVRAVNDLYSRCGGGALQKSLPLHRFWRDANVGLNHVTFSRATIFSAYAVLRMGIEDRKLIEMSGI